MIYSPRHRFIICKKHFLSQGLLLLAAVLITVLISACSHVPARQKLLESGCDIPLIEQQEGDCGYVSVPVDYENPNDGSYNIFWYYLPASEPTEDTRTVVALIGGPGPSSSGFLLDLFSTPDGTTISKLRKTHHIISYDYRATGLSDPFDARALPLCDISDSSTEDLSLVERMKQCRELLDEQGIEYGHITTAGIARDMDKILETKGIEDVVLLGFSYGTRVALTIIREVPERVAGVILDGTFPIEINGFEQGSEAPLMNLHYLFESYRENRSTLPAEFGDIPGRFTDFAKSVLGDEESKKNGANALAFISKYAYDKFRFVITHLLLEFLEAGDFEGFWNAVEGLRGYEEFPMDVSDQQVLPQKYADRPEGDFMSFSIIGTEELDSPLTDPPGEIDQLDDSLRQLFESYSEGAPIPENLAREVKEALRLESAASIEYQGVESDIPALLFTGRRDMQTPVHWGERVNKALRKSRHIILNGYDHVVSFSPNPCISDIAERFISNPEALDSLDTACVQNGDSINNNVEDFWREMNL